MNWITENVPILINFWKDVVYYRENGLNTHPEYIKKIQREIQKEKQKEEKKRENLNEKNKKKKCLIID